MTNQRRLLDDEIHTQLAQAFAGAAARKGVAFDVRNNGRLSIRFSHNGDRRARGIHPDPRHTLARPRIVR